MTADSSGVIVDTSYGQKTTDTVLMEQIKQQAEVKKHQSDAVNRAQNALLMRQKLEKERAEAGEKGSDNQS